MIRPAVTHQVSNPVNILRITVTNILVLVALRLRELRVFIKETPIRLTQEKITPLAEK